MSHYCNVCGYYGPNENCHRKKDEVTRDGYTFIPSCQICSCYPCECPISVSNRMNYHIKNTGLINDLIDKDRKEAGKRIDSLIKLRRAILVRFNITAELNIPDESNGDEYFRIKTNAGRALAQYNDILKEMIKCEMDLMNEKFVAGEVIKDLFNKYK